jgi:hypothetical protein
MEIPLLILMFAFITHVIITIISSMFDRRFYDTRMHEVNERCDALVKWCTLLDNQLSGMRMDNKTVPSKKKK